MDDSGLDTLGQTIVSALAGAATGHSVAFNQLTVTIEVSKIVEVVKFLRDDPALRFVSFIDVTAVDYFSDESVADDTYPYFDFLLDGRRVWREPYHGVVRVAGHEEVLAVLRDTASFSNCNIVAGPSFRFPVELTGDDVTGLVE